MSDNPKIELNELCSWLWGGAEILRGPVEHADFKTYLFPLLFLKRINDVWEEEHIAAIEQIGADFRENHRFQIPDGSRWSDIRSASVNVGQALQSSMREIESCNPVLEGIFGDAQWSNKERFTDERLKNIIEHFSKHSLGRDVSEGDLIGQAYEWTIKKFADLENKSAGEFYTPRAVIDLIIKILDPQPNHTIYDPACGTGGMLLEAVRYVRRRDGDIRSLYGKLYGQEKNFITSSMSRANLYLHGIEDFQIQRGDTLLEPKFLENGQLKKFDIVLANPPFSLKNWGHDHWINDRWGRNYMGSPPKNNADYAWIEHMIHSLKENGKMGVVLPQGVLFRMGSEGAIREKLIQEDLIECVIGLANNLFYGTGLAACIVVINKNKEKDKTGKVLLIDASKFFWKGKNQNILKLDHISNIFNLYVGFSDVKDVCKVVTTEQLRENNFNMNVPRYVYSKLHEDDINLDEAFTKVKKSMDSILKAEEKVNEKLSNSYLVEMPYFKHGGNDECHE